MNQYDSKDFDNTDFDLLENDSDELLDELEGEDSMVDDREDFTDTKFTPVLVVDDLDQLLAESVTIQQESVKGAYLRKELAKAKSLEEREALQAKIRAWEDAFEWETKRYCAMFENVYCSKCGNGQRLFSGFFYHQVHRKTPNTQRWVRTEDSGRPFDPSSTHRLTKAVLFRDVLAPFCAACALSEGFDISKGESLWVESVKI